jgi:hypothetical protein
MAAVAERLRLVRAARRKFLKLWAIDQALVEPLIDRLAADIAPDGHAAGDEPLHGEAPATDKG